LGRQRQVNKKAKKTHLWVLVWGGKKMGVKNNTKAQSNHQALGGLQVRKKKKTGGGEET